MIQHGVDFVDMTKHEGKDVLYRVNTRPWGETVLWMRDYLVSKRTPKGVWIEADGSRRFVLNNARKRWAHPTREEALKSFIRRRTIQLDIFQRRIADTERVLRIAYEADPGFRKPNPSVNVMGP